jgi:hypothetical protein
VLLIDELTGNVALVAAQDHQVSSATSLIFVFYSPRLKNARKSTLKYSIGAEFSKMAHRIHKQRESMFRIPRSKIPERRILGHF